MIPRSQPKEFTQRPEAGRPGVYVLTGPGPEDGGTDLAYIGEEGFLVEVLVCFPVLRLRVFEQPSNFPSINPSNLFFLRGPDAKGRGYESPNGFTVLKGAKGRRDFTASSPDALMRSREQLIRQGVLAKQGNQVELTAAAREPAAPVIGVDTNVLARYYVAEDEADAATERQRRAARDLIESGQPKDRRPGPCQGGTAMAYRSKPSGSGMSSANPLGTA